MKGLLQMPGVKVFEGQVDDGMVTFPNSDRVAPYIVIWPSTDHEGEQSLNYSETNQNDVMLTVAAGNVMSVLNIASEAMKRLHRVVIPGVGEYVRTEPFLNVRWDDTVTPGRHYLPMSFTLYK